ncbi:NUDIX domain-containing protein [Homoserinimonas sp. OAct 916]|uniref:NUDIX hydrolase n=1 Tax=Homoserinimonas sp. OAct 916 TaxID=2211450 RepID=UPI000DBE3DCB|nr:NUDIX domain-containing protein [Homoserinimonas sp. OAct 916]
MPVYRDSSGRSLTDYPRPSVAVDTAVLAVIPDKETLGVLLVRTGDGWRLPGTFLHEGERLADAVLRSLRVKAGVSGLAPTQLHVFDDPSRDDRGWVLSVAHVDAVPWSRLTIDESLARVTSVTEVRELPYGHNQIIDLAVGSLRERYRASPDPAHLLEPPFTLRQLQQLHEAVAGEPLMRDTFRRTMEPELSPIGEFAIGTVGKPARLFTREPTR